MLRLLLRTSLNVDSKSVQSMKKDGSPESFLMCIKEMRNITANRYTSKNMITEGISRPNYHANGSQSNMI